MSELLSCDQLAQARCVPCEGGVPKLTPEEITAQLQSVPGWEYVSGPNRIRKVWTVKHFAAGMAFFNAIMEVAEAERHHPDLHLTAYRTVTVEIWTHAIQGLSINDFILAAKIDRLPVQQKST